MYQLVVFIHRYLYIWMYMYIWVFVCVCVCVCMCVCVYKEEKQERQVLNLLVEPRLIVGQQQQPIATSYQRKSHRKTSYTGSYIYI